MPDLISTVLQLAQPLQDDVENLSASEVLRYYSQPRQYPAGTSGLYQVVMDLVPILLLSRSRRKQRQKEREWKRLQEEASLALDIYNRWQNLGPTDYEEYLKLQREALGAMGRLSLSPLRALVSVVSTTPPQVKEIQMRQLEDWLQRQREVFRQQLALHFEPLRQLLLTEIEVEQAPRKEEAVQMARLRVGMKEKLAMTIDEAITRLQQAISLPQTSQETANEIVRLTLEAKEWLAEGKPEEALKVLYSSQDPTVRQLLNRVLTDATFKPFGDYIRRVAGDVIGNATNLISSELWRGNVNNAMYYYSQMIANLMRIGLPIEEINKVADIVGASVRAVVDVGMKQMELSQKDREAMLNALKAFEVERMRAISGIQREVIQGQYGLLKEKMQQDVRLYEAAMRAWQSAQKMALEWQQFLHRRQFDLHKMYIDNQKLMMDLEKLRMEGGKYGEYLVNQVIDRMSKLAKVNESILKHAIEAQSKGIPINPQFIYQVLQNMSEISNHMNLIVGTGGSGTYGYTPRPTVSPSPTPMAQSSQLPPLFFEPIPNLPFPTEPPSTPNLPPHPGGLEPF